MDKENLWYPLYTKPNNLQTEPYMSGGVSELLWNRFKNPHKAIFQGDDATESSFVNALISDWTNSLNYRMWQENNEYNSPVQQMERMNEAGLNPNLFYNQGTPGNSSSPFQANAPHYETNRRAFNLETASMILNQINQFANGVANLVDTSTKLYGRTQYDLPMMANEKYLSDFRANAFYNTFVGTSEQMDEKGISETNRFPFMKIDGTQYYVAGQNGYFPFFSPDVLKGLSGYATRYYQNTFQDMYQNHMQKMYPSEEKRAAAEAAIKEYIEQFEKDVPREFRWMLPVFASFLKIF